MSNLLHVYVFIQNKQKTLTTMNSTLLRKSKIKRVTEMSNQEILQGFQISSCMCFKRIIISFNFFDSSDQSPYFFMT